MISGKKEIQNIPVVWEWSWCPKKHSWVIRSSHLCSHLWFWFNGELFQQCKIMRYTSESWIMLSMENVQGFVNRSSSCSNPLWSVKSIISRHLGCFFLCCTSFLTFGQHNEHNAQDSHWHVSALMPEGCDREWNVTPNRSGDTNGAGRIQICPGSESQVNKR